MTEGIVVEGKCCPFLLISVVPIVEVEVLAMLAAVVVALPDFFPFK
jgi:hypothetical protein